MHLVSTPTITLFEKMTMVDSDNLEETAKSGSSDSSDSTDDSKTNSSKVRVQKAIAMLEGSQPSRSLSNLYHSIVTPKQPSAPPALLEDVDHVLSGVTSADDAKDLLRGMVSDLLRENDTLSGKLKTTQQELAQSNERCDQIQTIYQHQLDQLQRTVDGIVGHTKEGESSFTKAIQSKASACSSSSYVLSPTEATALTIQTLSDKISSLHTENTQLQNDLAHQQERLEDLESLNEARLHTIDALEAHFKSITELKKASAVTGIPLRTPVKAASQQLVVQTNMSTVPLKDLLSSPHSKNSSTTPVTVAETPDVVANNESSFTWGESPLLDTTMNMSHYCDRLLQTAEVEEI